MFQISVPVTLRLFIMPTRKFCHFYRMGLTLRQYCTRIKPPKVTASSASHSGAAKTKPKGVSEVIEEDRTMPFVMKRSSTKLIEKGMQTSVVHESEEEVGKNGVETKSKLNKPIPLYDAVDPRELEWRKVGAAKLSELPGHYLMLSKFRLTSLVVLTSVGGYAMAPFPVEICPLIALAFGTGLVSSAANAINQFLEAPFDAQMPRTRNRCLVRGLLTPGHAVGFAVGSAISGACILWTFTNPATTALGILNILLYTSVYTPLKRVTIANTWVGSIVGAIPPLMGWSACSGGSLGVGAWLVAGLLFAWQFPHFNALSWNLRQEYSRAGYRMMAVTDPGLCRRTALRYSIGMLGLCLAAPVLDVTTWTFAFDSFPLNAYLTYLAWKFYKESDSRSSRNLFRFTLVHLPALMLLMLISKKHYYSEKGATDAEISQLVNTSGVSGSEAAPSLITVMPAAEKTVL